MAFIRRGPGFMAVIVGSLAIALLVAGMLGRAFFVEPDSTPEPTFAPSFQQSATSTVEATPPPATPVSTPAAIAAIDPAVLVENGVNELGVIPVIMYHAFATNPDPTDIWTRSLEDFRGDLQYLYDSNFHVISMRNLLDGEINVPLGKHPVVLTYDDASARQFQFEQNAQGELVPTADSAVGVLEEFFAAHPDFGKSSHFAIVGNNCFGWRDEIVEFNSGDEYCQLKLQWLSDNGYEIGNHTWTHENLFLIDGEDVAEQVGKNALFIDERVQGPGNQRLVLTLPFGDSPAADSTGASYLANGVWYEHHEYLIEAMIRVSGGPMYSPFSTWWDPLVVTRFNSDEESLNIWFGAFERGEVALYTSDGNSDTVTIPDPLPEYLQNELDPAYIAGLGKTLVTYEIPATESSADADKARDDGHHRGDTLTDLPALSPGVVVYTNEEFVRLRAEPSTVGDVIEELDKRVELTIVSGPVEADDYIWWQVKTEDGAEGWVVEDFLSGPPSE